MELIQLGEGFSVGVAKAQDFHGVVRSINLVWVYVVAVLRSTSMFVKGFGDVYRASSQMVESIIIPSSIMFLVRPFGRLEPS